MLIGAMNNPGRPVREEIEWLSNNRFDFLDLTLEPPLAASWKIDVPAIRRMLEGSGLCVVGHTAPILPIASPVPELQRASIVEFCRCIDVFQGVGAKWMNVHPGISPMHDRAFTIARNVESLRELLRYGKDAGVGVMIENLPGNFNTAQQLAELLEPLPELGLLLDVGHANLMSPVNTMHEISTAFGKRIRHVHLHDNRGGALDLHLPLGTGNVNVPDMVDTLRRCGYDGTITLEVFSEDRHHLLYSREVLQRAWGMDARVAKAKPAGS
jgi:sugar phosphate isomerase/epimerase